MSSYVLEVSILENPNTRIASIEVPFTLDGQPYLLFTKYEDNTRKRSLDKILPGGTEMQNIWTEVKSGSDMERPI